MRGVFYFLRLETGGADLLICVPTILFLNVWTALRQGYNSPALQTKTKFCGGDWRNGWDTPSIWGWRAVSICADIHGYYYIINCPELESPRWNFATKEASKFVYNYNQLSFFSILLTMLGFYLSSCKKIFCHYFSLPYIFSHAIGARNDVCWILFDGVGFQRVSKRK